MGKFSGRSLENLNDAHADLRRLFDEVVKISDCTILCGYRNERTQNEMYRSGKSQLPWPKSKHNMKPSLAVDVAPYPIDFKDILRFVMFSDLVKMVAKQLGIDVVWGGDWRSFKDYVHWELKPKAKQPKRA